MQLTSTLLAASLAISGALGGVILERQAILQVTVGNTALNLGGLLRTTATCLGSTITAQTLNQQAAASGCAANVATVAGVATCPNAATFNSLVAKLRADGFTCTVV